MASVTAMRTTTMPMTCMSVQVSFKNMIPMNTAVSGSRAPRMAVVVGPTLLTARIRVRSDTSVGTSASKTRCTAVDMSGMGEKPPSCTRTLMKKMSAQLSKT